MASERLDRIFRRNGRTVIIALDHGLIDGPCAGLERPGDTIAAVVAGGPDAILTSYGIARQFSAELESVAVILRSDGAVSNLATPSPCSVGRFFGAVRRRAVGCGRAGGVGVSRLARGGGHPAGVGPHRA